MEAVRRALRWLFWIEATVAVVAFLVVATALMADVLGREFFGDGIFGAQRVAVWATAIAGLGGFALVTAQGGHLRPQFADSWLPASWEPQLLRLADVISAAICLALAWYAWDFVMENRRLGERGMAIPILVWPIQLILPWMFASSALRYLAFAAFPPLRPAQKGEAG
ncbi:MAG: TRAP transporter small permease [Reyranellaceae bacterium]